MKATLQLTAVLATTATVLAQNFTIPATDGSLPTGGSNGCAAGYYPGIDTVLFTVPYTYQQVMSIVGNYTNLTWSGSPDNSVTTNNSQALAMNNWTPGTARTYDVAGAHVIETITEYSKPINGPYVEVHTLAPLSIPTANVSFYSDFDGQVWKPICDGKATWSNFTITFCATNATTAQQVLHMLHSTDAMTVGTFLGGQNFTSCSSLTGNGTASPGAYGNGSASSPTSAPVPYTGGAGGKGASVLLVAMLAAIVLALA
ncbi:hypothetical protein LTR56_006486 [Elasticomyces elasticus]|nr:hypothetical protein LTR22_012941 [Elasticomyces elasticus]KAK3650211.1 hypothetical protein LTR56_006486 [Elasticomyces elasticus]KAK4927014.1 hypothetical protein LTR49_006171 [Elasticomyces elasticus]KAK5764342.1 hypothetical protein LTS12_005555 [Elasticomyces elasticus]